MSESVPALPAVVAPDGSQMVDAGGSAMRDADGNAMLVGMMYGADRKPMLNPDGTHMHTAQLIDIHPAEGLAGSVGGDHPAEASVDAVAAEHAHVEHAGDRGDYEHSARKPVPAVRERAKRFKPAPALMVEDEDAMTEEADAEAAAAEVPVVLTDEEAHGMGLVKMVKGLDVMHVHPSAIRSHMEAHWMPIAMDKDGDASRRVVVAPVVLTDEEAHEEGLVKMTKHGEVTHVHPSAVASHVAMDWMPVPMDEFVHKPVSPTKRADDDSPRIVEGLERG